MKKKKETKQRTSKYETKLVVKGTFEDLLKVSVNKPKKEEGKKE